jgi:hypothetical protein
VPTSTEEAARSGPAGSIDPKALRVTPVGLADVAPILIECHYLHAVGAAAARCFGVIGPEGSLVGAAVVGPGPRHAHRLLQGGRSAHVVSLDRFWLDDACGRNAESRVLAVILRTLRAEGRWKLLVSYSDPTAGHVGTIYRAAGFAFLGFTQSEAYLEFADGAPRHRRSIANAFGTNDQGHLARTGFPTRRVVGPAKLRYAAILDPAWAWRLAIQPMPYPADPRSTT